MPTKSKSTGKAPAFQFYVRDWLSDPQLRQCSPATKGIWIDCLCYMWESPERGRLKVTKESLARMTGSTPDEIVNFFQSVIFASFCDAEMTNADGEMTLTNRRMYRDQKNKDSHKLRQARYVDRRKNDAKMTPPSSSSSSSIVFSNEKTTPLPPKGGVCVEQVNFELLPQDGDQGEEPPAGKKKYTYPPDFETFWEAYPRRVGKKAAEMAWKARKKEGALPPLPDVLRALEAQKNAPGWQRDGGQYIPNPATWLNQGRWDDELGKNVKSGNDDGISPELRDMLERRRMERENANRG